MNLFSGMNLRWRLVAYFLPLIVLPTAAIVFFISSQWVSTTRDSVDKIEETETVNLALEIETYLKGLESDIRVIAGNPDTRQLAEALASDDALAIDEARASVERSFLNFSQVSGIYDQVRFIAADGMEFVRVDSDGQTAFIVDRDRLQNKTGRSYFDGGDGTGGAINQPEGSLYISALNLNREGSPAAIEILPDGSTVPVIRYGMPVFVDGEVVGAVITNVFAQPMLDLLVENSGEDEHFLVNSDGYFLYNTANPALAFGFEDGIDAVGGTFGANTASEPIFEGVETSTFADLERVDHDQELEEVQDNDHANMNGWLFHFNRVAPPSAPDGYYWTLVTIIEEAAIFGVVQQIQMISAVMLGILALFGVTATIYLTRQITDPITQLNETARGIAEGNYSASVVTATNRDDEIGQLSTSFGAMQERLKETIGSLEEKVQTRTKDLEIASAISSEVAAAPTYQDMLKRFVQLTRERFELYHAHVYVVDEQRTNLVLAAGADERGDQMVEQGHTIPLDREHSLVARAARSQQPIIIGDTQDAENFMANPLLPDTRSEMAIPMIAENRIIGVLDVQSAQPERFNDSDARVLSTMAAQIAVAVRNAKTFQEAERTRQEVNRLYNTSIDMMGTANLEGYFVSVNPAFEKVLGYTSAEMMAEPFLNKVHPDDQAATNAEAAKIAEGADTLSFENRYQHKDGHWAWISWTSSVDMANGVIHFVARDITEQKQRTLAMEQQSTIINNSNDFIALTTMEGEITYLNPGGAKMMGFARPEDAIGNRISDYHQPSGTKLVQNEAIPAIMKHDSWRSENELLTRDGQLIPVDQTLFLVRDASGNPINIGAIMIDITERKLSEQQVQVYANVMQNTSSGIHVWRLEDPDDDTSLRFIVGNSASKAATGIDPKDIAMQKMEEAFPQLMQTEIPALYAGIAKGGDAVDLGEVEYEDENVDKSTFYVKAFPLPDRSVGVSFEDITARKEATKQIEIYADVMRNTSAAVQVWRLEDLDDDLSLTFVTGNSAAEKLARITAEESTGKTFADLFPTIVNTPLPTTYATVARTGQSINLGELPFPDEETGEVITFTINAFPLPDNGVGVSFEDVTARVRSEENTRVAAEASAALAQANNEQELLHSVTGVAEKHGAALFTLVYFKGEDDPLDVAEVVAGQIGADTELDLSTLPATRFERAQFPLIDMITRKTNESTFISIEDEDLPESVRLYMQAAQFGASLLIPLNTAGVWQGAISMSWPESRETPQQLIDLANQLIPTASSAVASRRTYLDAQTAREEAAKRAAELQTVAEVSTQAATNLDSDELLWSVTNVTRDAFDLYHAHIYLLNDAGDTLILTAGAGDAGRTMVAEGRTIAFDHPHSIVATAARERRGIIANNVRENEDFLPHPMLPNTQAEMSVPMVVGDRVVGVLDVQADVTDRFTDEDVQIKTTLASQIAVAITNAQTYDESQRSQSLMLNLINSIPDLIFYKNVEGTYLGANNAFGELVGREPETLIGITDYDLFPQEIADFFRENDQTMMEQNQSRTNEEWLDFPDGRHLLYDTLKTPLIGLDGKPMGVLGISRDITDRRRAEQRQETLSEVSAALARAANEQELLSAITGVAEKEYGASLFTLVYFNGEDDPLDIADVVAGQTGGGQALDLAMLPATRFPREQFPLIDMVIQNKNAVTFIRRDDPELPEAVTAYMEAAQFGASLLMPLVTGDDWQGIFSISWTEEVDAPSQLLSMANALIPTASASVASRRAYLAAEAANQISQKRAAEMETVAQVSADAATNLDVEELLWEVSDLTRNSFDLYHAHIYLLNAQGDTLVLSAGAGEAGKIMVAENRTIAYDRPDSLVATAARTRQGVIANDVRKNPNFLPHAMLPETRSEMAIPMVVGNEVIGVLDVQANVTDRFTDEDVQVKTTLASQVAIAVKNARAFEQTRQQSSIIETSEDFISLTDMQGNAVYLNPGGAKLIGLASNDVTGLSIPDFHAPEDAKRVAEEGIPVVMETGSWSGENYLLHRDGHKIPVDQTIFLVRDDEGNPVNMGTIMSDISERKEQEAILEQSRQRLSDAIRTAQLGYWEFDYRTGKFTFDEDFMELLGTTIEAEGGTEMAAEEYATRFVVPEHAAIVGENVAEAAATTDPNFSLELEADIIRADNGERRTMLVKLRVEQDGNGQTIKLIGTNQDITERKKSQEEFDRQRRLLDAIVSNIPSGIFVVEAPSATPIFTNRRAEELLGRGISPDANEEHLAEVYEAYKEGTDDLYPAAEQPIVRGIYGETSHIDDMEIRRPDGKSIKLEISGAPIKDDNDNIVASVVAFNDITERKEQDETRRMRAEISAALAHADNEQELLSAISGVAQQEYGASLLTLTYFTGDHDALDIAEVVAGQIGTGDPLDLSMLPATSFTREQFPLIDIVTQNENTVTFIRTDDPELPEAVGQYMQAAGFGAALLMPLVTGDDWQGIFSIMWPEPTDLPEQLRYLANTLVPTASATIASRRAYLDAQIARDETAQYAEEQSALGEVAAALARAGDEQEILSAITGVAEAEYGASLFTLVYFNGEGDPLDIADVVAGQTGGGQALDLAMLPATRFPREQFPLIDMVIQNKNAVTFIRRDDPELPESVSAYMHAAQFGASMLMPLVTGREWHGIFSISWTNEVEAPPQLLSMASQLIPTASASVASRRAYLDAQIAREDAARRAGELETVAEVSAATTTILNQEELLQSVVDLTKEAFNLYHAHIYLVDIDGERMVLAAGAGEPGRRMKVDGHSIPLNSPTSLVVQAARTREGVVVNDITRSAGFLPNPRLPKTRSEMAIPMIASGNLIGVLDVQSERRNRFTDADVTIKSTLAAQVAVAIENVRIFAEVEAQAERERAIAERLREVDRLKSQFLANMSHELRTPLNSIIGYSEVLLDGVDGDLTDDAEEDVEAIHNSGKHLLSIINEILDLAKIEANQMQLDLKPVDLVEFAGEIVRSAQPLVKDKPVNVNLIQDGDIPMVSADAVRLRQIIWNLMSNAVKFTEEGDVELRLDMAEEGLARVTVADSGIGMTREDLGKIFERFSQVDGSSTRRAGGTGLGLTITKQLIEMHGGYIEVDSVYGEGTTFWFTVPVYVPEEA